MDNPFAQITQQSSQEENPFSQIIGQSILPVSTSITQPYGNQNPNVEVMSGGINYGTDFSAQKGTPISLPPGIWEVVDSYSQDKTPGHIGDSTNRGYGNSVLVKNFQTGEKLRFSHLSQNNLQSGQIVEGGEPFGATGDTGNVTGPHLDLEYYTPQGQLADVMKSPYSQYIQ